MKRINPRNLLSLFCCFIFSCLLFSQNTFAQTKPKSKGSKVVKNKIYIGGIGVNSLFSDKSNLIVVALQPDTGTSYTTTDSQPTFILTSSQGKISLYDKNMFVIDNLKIGKTILKAYKVVDTGKVFVASKVFYADTSKEKKELGANKLNPGINLGGYAGGHNGRIPINVINKLNKLDLNSEYRIISATVYIGSDRGDVRSFLLYSAYFGEDLKKAWAKLTPGLIITFDAIKFDKNGGKPYWNDGITFAITDSVTNITPPPTSQ